MDTRPEKRRLNRRNNLQLLLFCVGIGVLAGIYFFEGDLSKTAEFKVPTIFSTQPLEISDGIRKIAPSSEAQTQNHLNTLETAAKNCFPSESSLSREFLIEETLNNTTAEFQFENWHLKLPSGEELRVMQVLSDRENAKKATELKLFKLDAEGLPEEIESPVFNPTVEQIKIQLAKGEIFFHQKKQNLELANNLRAEVLVENHKIKELQIIGNHNVLSCFREECTCASSE